MVGAIIAGAGALTNIGFGVYDRVQASKQYKKAQSFFESNKYEIPESSRAALDVAQRGAASIRMPGQDIAEARIGQATASGLEQASRVGRTQADVLGSLVGLYGQQMGAEQNLALQAAGQYQQNQRNFQQALNQYGNLENQRWQYNVLYPYQQMLGRAAQFQERGTAELNTGLMGLAQTGATLDQAMTQEKQYQQWLDSMSSGRMQTVQELGGYPTKALPVQQPSLRTRAQIASMPTDSRSGPQMGLSTSAYDNRWGTTFDGVVQPLATENRLDFQQY